MCAHVRCLRAGRAGYRGSPWASCCLLTRACGVVSRQSFRCWMRRFSRRSRCGS
ncbi:hypothetical protein ACFPRL_36485 [Pseudoclavibacter helvolus]